MAMNGIGVVVRHLRRMAGPPWATPDDRTLLDRYARTGDPEAFAALVARHGPLVLGVAGRALGRSADADDVFQAAFLVLARRAASVRRRDVLGPWLFGVAVRLARQARRAAAVRRERERRAAVLRPEVVSVADAGRLELLAALDAELAALPERLRAPLVLCYLEGRTQADAARRLGWSFGTLRRRLDRGRALLRARLTRLGATPNQMPDALLLTPPIATVPPALVDATLATARSATLPEAIAVLVQGSVSVMTRARVTILAAVCAAVGLMVGVGAALQPEPAAPLPVVMAAAPVPGAGAPAPGRDWYGDPLPAGALARLGTVAFRSGDLNYYLIAFSRDGRTIVTSDHRRLRFWDVESGRERCEPLTLEGRNASLDSIGLSADGRKLRALQYTLDGGITLALREWDAVTRQGLREMRLGGARRTWGQRTTVNLFAPRSLFSPDGRMLAVVDEGELGVALWNTEAGALWHHVEVDSATVGMAFGGDGKTLVTAHDDHTFRVWDIATGKEVLRFDGEDRTNVFIAVSADGRTLASVGHTPNGPGNRISVPDSTVALWDLTAGKRLRVIDTQTRIFFALTFTPDGRSILTCGSGDDARLELWDVATGRRVWQSPRSCASVARLAFTSDGKTAAGEVLGRIVRWDLATGREIGEDHGHVSGPMAIEFAPDGRRVFTEAADGTRREWELATGRPLGVRPTGGPPMRYFTRDRSRYVASRLDGGNRICLCDAATDRALREWPMKAVNAPALSRDGRWVAVLDGQSVRVAETATGKEVWTHSVAGNGPVLGRLLFTPDGSRLTFQDDPRFMTWEAATGKLLSEWNLDDAGLYSAPTVMPVPVGGGRPFPVVALDYSPDGRHLALALQCGPPDKGPLVVVEAATGKTVTAFPTVTGAAHHVRFSPDGKMLAMGGSESVVSVCDVTLGREVRRYAGHHGWVSALEFSPDGRRLVSGGRDTTGLVWEVPLPGAP